MRSFSDGEIQIIIKLQANVRGILARIRFRKALQHFRNIMSECGESENDLNQFYYTFNHFGKNRTCSVSNNHSFEKSKLPELYALRYNLFLETIWLDQAISSRCQFLMYKQDFNAHFD
ncbi:hypothetical protein EWB00_006616 [Schistosoma japonicum]|uniref:Uncharacterized protein n=1 Tax=Schistosoma japonicum TaxID=6182 RepID=A0A4Z2CXR2_SCHJA|nr:hypothetical protein KSF78_0005981 [Schistosoma japonicum]KAH8870662.1 hypothetical protein KSF78_0005981 [Schistosoma japonicum]TNN09026.1 hypothetical protein EWB00_006616 [Schistosoma japonicum]TNN09027.1 hypothetical protein EWB00_006616 [Schistosoma japonicum]